MNVTKKRILLVSVVVIAVLAAAFMVYAILVTPAKQPYRDALAQYKNVYNANVALMARGSALGAGTATDQQFKDNVAAVEVTLKAIEAENELLGKKEVIANGDAKNLYATFNEKLDAYVAYNRAMLSSMLSVRPVVYSCSQKMSKVAENETGVQAMRGCAQAFEALKDIPNPDYQTLVDSSRGIYGAFADTLQKRANLADPEGADKAQSKLLADEQSGILKQLDELSATFARNLTKNKQAVDITESAMALDTFLDRKAAII